MLSYENRKRKESEGCLTAFPMSLLPESEGTKREEPEVIHRWTVFFHDESNNRQEESDLRLDAFFCPRALRTRRVI